MVLEDGRPAAGAAVWYVDQSLLQRGGAKLQRSQPEPIALPGRLKVLGAPKIADEKGRIQIRVVGRHLALQVECERQAATEVIDLDSLVGDVVRVTLARGDLLQIELVDLIGEPISDAPLVVAPILASGGWDGAWRVRLGATDAGGKLSFEGWNRLRLEIGASFPGNPIAVGVEYVGGVSAFEVVPVVLPDKIRVVTPRPVCYRCDIVDSTGAPLEWAGHVLRVFEDSGGVEGQGAVTRHGQATLLAVSGRRYRWHLGSGSGIQPPLTLGEGSTWFGPDGRVTLRCEQVVRAVGRLASEGVRDGVRLQYDSAVHGRQESKLAVDESGRFGLQLVRGEIGPLLFVSGKESVSVALPPLDQPVVELGVIHFASAAFAELIVVDEKGVAIPHASIAPAGVARQFVSVHEVACGQFRIQMVEPRYQMSSSSHELLLDCSAAGRARKLVRVNFRESRRVELRRLEDLKIQLRIPPDVPVSLIWVRLVRRFDPGDSDWWVVDRWEACVRGQDGVPCATFAGQLPGRYEVGVFSGLPPACLVDAEVDLANEQPLILDASRTRVLSLNLQDSNGEGAKSYLAAGATVDAYDRVPMGLVPISVGTTICVLRADETWLALMGPSQLPARIMVGGASASHSIRTLGVELPGEARGATLIRPLGRAYGGERIWHLFRANGGRMHRDILRRDQVIGGVTGWLLPTDYEATDEKGHPLILEFRGNGQWHRRP
jgi:hypothetical protein